VRRSSEVQRRGSGAAKHYGSKVPNGGIAVNREIYWSLQG